MGYESRQRAIARIAAVYDNNRSWVKRLENMPETQLWAIYYRFAKLDFDLARIRRKPRVEYSLTTKPSGHTSYYCNTCKQSFVADNPELTECRWCGSTYIVKEEDK